MTDILKLIEPLISILLGKHQIISEKSIELTKEILNQLRRVVSLVAMLVGSLVLFCLGMSYFISRTLDQLDRGSFSLTPSLIFLICFMLICVVVALYSTNKKTWIKILKNDDEDNDENQQLSKKVSEQNNPIEAAVSLFILDLVKEREFNREQERKTPIKTEE